MWPSGAESEHPAQLDGCNRNDRDGEECDRLAALSIRGRVGLSGVDGSPLVPTHRKDPKLSAEAAASATTPATRIKHVGD